MNALDKSITSQDCRQLTLLFSLEEKSHHVYRQQPVRGDDSTATS
jgi:hypothetical protein